MGVMEARRRILLNTPHITTPASAGLVNFSTDMIAPLKECKVHFSPVQEGSGDPSPDNVRPITGWTGVEVYKDAISGAGTANVEWTSGYINLDREISAASPRYAEVYSNFIPIEPGATYTFGYELTKEPGKKYWASIGWYKSNSFGTGFRRNARGERIDYAPLTATAPNSARYAALSFRSFNAIKSIYFVSDSATPLPVDWTSAGTVYGGYVDLVTGEVWETWTAVDMGIIDWLKSTQGNKFYVIGLNRDYPWQSDLTMYCPIYKFDGANVGTDYYGDDCTIRYFYRATGKKSREIYIHDERFDNAADFKTAMAGIPLVYSLDTPAIIATITPAVLKTLRGTNNIWSNANGNIDLSYWTH